MTYQETLAHIYARGRFGMKPGLERITQILKSLGNPQDAFAVVHLVGTNGKGSTASFLSSILQAGNHRTGLFTSPHLMSFTERMRIDGEEIPEPAVSRLTEAVMSAAPPEATFFEIVTALAALYFAESGVEIAVFEAGMGGGLDATNALNGMLSVVTPISLDHCDYLGRTISEIAAEKAGILKKGTPLVCGLQHPDAVRVIARRAADQGSPLYLQDVDFASFWEGDRLRYRGLGVELEGMLPGVAGRYQSGNVACALAAAELLAERGFKLEPSHLVRGVERAFWPGRMETFPGAPPVLLDGAHNPAGAQALAEALDDVQREKLWLVLGVMGDKELSGILSPLLPLADGIFAVAPALERALPAAELADRCRDAGYRAEAAGSLEQGLCRARAVAGKDDLIVVCGSLFTVGEARSLLLSRGFEPFRG